MNRFSLTAQLFISEKVNAIDHLKNAYSNGFSYSAIGAPVIISDGLLGRRYYDFEINKKHFEKIKLGIGFIVENLSFQTFILFATNSLCYWWN